MKCAIIMRKVPYRLPNSPKIVWGIILSQNCGLTLLFVQKDNNSSENELVICAENVAERVFEAVPNASRYPMPSYHSLKSISVMLDALGEGLSETELKNFLMSDEDCW